MIGFLVVEMVIGYKWCISGLVKFVRGGFPAGLTDELLAKSAGTAKRKKLSRWTTPRGEDHTGWMPHNVNTPRSPSCSISTVA